MATPLRLQLRPDDPANVLAPIVQDYREHFEARRYQAKRVRRYVASVFHFGDWLRSEDWAVQNVDEAVVGRFISEHLPNCTCPRPVQGNPIINRAALNHLIRILYAKGIIHRPAADPITRELALFDEKMMQVWGLAQGTRDHRCRIIRRLLKAQFGSGSIDPTSISPSTIRSFVLDDTTWSRSTIRVMAGAVRCYLRHRKLLGDNVTDLMHAVPQPACWGQTKLPEALSGNELEQLFRSFDAACPSQRRGYAMVRCLADLSVSEAARSSG